MVMGGLELIKWPAEYHRAELPRWMSESQLDICDRAVKVLISSDKTVVEAFTEDSGFSMWKNNTKEHVK